MGTLDIILKPAEFGDPMWIVVGVVIMVLFALYTLMREIFNGPTIKH